MAKPAGRALEMGPWTTTIKTVKAKATPTLGWGPKVTVALGIPSKPGASHSEIQLSTKGNLNQPYGLHGPGLPPPAQKPPHNLLGIASYYWQGQKTATGETFDPSGMTAAHKTLPFGTRVRVTRVDTGESVVVRINDRGPFKPGRVIDLSKGAAKNLGMLDAGLTDVRLEVLAKH
ncbi:septal ring lytic transglycosylase RlpA family protein [Hyphomicrobium methylovorum]|uniref:septal ring lytic transglycosylase RlpA family protein n=1 Tax=Hyphomicrobium methylovorum TaxID=84 RepID=UPI001FEA4315|nr:septal ring lytic transglycosylase RlpA family protein [Hyphomicrobium methylovorum]